MNTRIPHIATVFLQAVGVIVGIGMAAALLIEPLFEGRNAHASLFAVYVADPFLVYAYAGSVPFFLALSRIVALLGYAKSDKIFSPEALRALRTIRSCALLTILIVTGAITFLSLAAQSSNDDPAGAFALGILACGICLVTAAIAAVCERVVQRGMRNAPTTRIAVR